MNIKTTFYLLLLAATMWQGTYAANYDREKCAKSSSSGYATPVSMISLLVNSDKFDGKWVSFSGYIGGVSNSMGLFFVNPSMESGKLKVREEAIVGKITSEYKNIAIGDYVFISGLFKSGPYQYDTASVGFGTIDEICEISKIDISKKSNE